MNENAIQTTRTPEVIAAEIRTFSGQILINILEIGRRMEEAKDLLPYGSFGEWVKETGYSLSTANNFMRIFREYGGQITLFGTEAECQTFGKLTYSKALALLEIPPEEREEAARELDAEHLSTRELKKAIQERNEAIQRAEEAENKVYELETNAEDTELFRSRAQEAEAEIKRLEEKIGELEKRPVDVAVQEADPAEVEKAVHDALTAAKAESDKKLSAVKEQEKAERDKLAEKLREAEEKLKASESGDREELDRLRAEAEDLKKRLKITGTELHAFETRFKVWQEAYNSMMTALDKVQGDVKTSCAAAISAVLASWQEAGEVEC